MYPPTTIQEVNKLSSNDDGSNKRGGSRKGKARNKDRDFQVAYDELIKNYFSGDDSVYNKVDFEKQFGVPREIFIAIYNASILNQIFVCKYNPVTKNGVYIPLSGLLPVSQARL